VNIGAYSPTEFERKRWRQPLGEIELLFCVYTDIAPLIRGNRPTDQRIAGGGARESLAGLKGPNLNNWIVFRQIEGLQFRRVVCKVYPRPRANAARALWQKAPWLSSEADLTDFDSGGLTHSPHV
jgi:hypothetical protein